MKARGSNKSDETGKLRSALKKEIKRLGLKANVRANDSGCLDLCKQGPAVVIYPQAIWYGGVTTEDAERIIQQTVVEGQILEDLLIPEDVLKCPKGDTKSGKAKDGKQ